MEAPRRREGSELRIQNLELGVSLCLRASVVQVKGRLSEADGERIEYPGHTPYPAPRGGEEDDATGHLSEGHSRARQGPSRLARQNCARLTGNDHDERDY